MPVAVDPLACAPAPKLWPDCQWPMRDLAAHLAAHGADAGEIVTAFRRDFPGLRDAYYLRYASEAEQDASKHRGEQCSCGIEESANR